jgi:hypothetical protein
MTIPDNMSVGEVMKVRAAPNWYGKLSTGLRRVFAKKRPLRTNKIGAAAMIAAAFRRVNFPSFLPLRKGTSITATVMIESNNHSSTTVPYLTG